MKRIKKAMVFVLSFMLMFTAFAPGITGAGIMTAKADEPVPVAIDDRFVLAADINGVRTYATLLPESHYFALSLEITDREQAEIFTVASAGDGGFRLRPVSNPDLLIRSDLNGRTSNQFMLQCRVDAGAGGLWETIVFEPLSDNEFLLEERNQGLPLFAVDAANRNPAYYLQHYYPVIAPHADGAGTHGRVFAIRVEAEPEPPTDIPPPVVNNFGDIVTFALRVNDGAGNFTYATVGANNQLNHAVANLSDADIFTRRTNIYAGTAHFGFNLFGTQTIIQAAYSVGHLHLPGHNNLGPWERFAMVIADDGAFVIRPTYGHVPGNPFVFAASDAPSAQLRAMGADPNNPYLRVEVMVVEYTNPTVPATGIELSHTEITMDRNNSVTVTAIGYTTQFGLPSSNILMPQFIEWTSSNPFIASVDDYGVITAIGPGVATITATARGVSGTVSVIIEGAPILAESVSITAAGGATSVPVDINLQLTANFVPIYATNQDVTWSSSDTNLATVNEYGVVRGVSEGNVTITVTTYDGPTATINLTVTERPPVIDFHDIQTFALRVRYVIGGETSFRYVTLGADGIVSLRPTAAHINDAALFDLYVQGGQTAFRSRENGNLVCADIGQGLRANHTGGIGAWEEMTVEVLPDGIITLFAPFHDGFIFANSDATDAMLIHRMGNNLNTDPTVQHRRVELVVIEYANPSVAATGITLNQTTATIDQFMGTTQLEVTGFTPANASNTIVPNIVSWSSNAPHLATVNANGLVTGMSVGVATITATVTTLEGVFTATSEVTMAFEGILPTGIEMRPAARDLTLGFTAALSATLIPEATTVRRITWESDNEAVATVDQNGVVTSHSLGVAVITATTEPGAGGNPFTATSTITVVPPRSFPYPNIYPNPIASDDVVVYVMNVMDFGAWPEDPNELVTDNTAAFQAAINAAMNAGGGVVFAPAGVYRFDGRLHLPSGVTLRGEWLSPLEGGGRGEGTILAVYADRGDSNMHRMAGGGTARSFITLNTSATVRDISFWYPEQCIENVVSYPFTIGDDTVAGGGHDVINVMNVTMYNSYRGVMSFNTHGCTTVRNLFGTILHIGITEDAGFDIGRLENIYFCSKYWANSSLPGAPPQDQISAFTRTNAIGVDMFQNDWGYMFNLNFSHMNIGLQMNDGNCAVSNMTTRDVNIGINVRALSFPGFKLAYSDIEASVAGINYNVPPNWALVPRTRSDGSTKSWIMQAGGLEQLAVMTTRFSGTGTSIVMNTDRELNNPVISVNASVFESWGDWAIDAARGSVVIMDSDFIQSGLAVRLAHDISAANILANRLTDSAIESQMAEYRKNIDHRPIPQLVRPPATYEYEFAPIFRPANPTNFVNAHHFGVTPDGSPRDLFDTRAGNFGRTVAQNGTDNTAALQAALDYAAASGGGTVFLPGGTYWISGSVIIPSGVQLRGTYDAPHSGKIANTVDNAGNPIRTVGTVIVVYSCSAFPGNSDNATIVLTENSAIRGIAFYYPDQRIEAIPGVTIYGEASLRSADYPWAIRAEGDNISIANIALINAVNGFDIIGGRNIVLADMNSYALGTQVRMGIGGAVIGGWIQDVHFNQANWEQSNWHTAPLYDQVALFAGYHITGFKFGAVMDVHNFQNFTITVDRAIWMVEEPRPANCPTGGVFSGVFNGFAFDSNQIGLDIENAGEVIFINAMSVQDLPRPGWRADGVVGGPNIRTSADFTGTLKYFNGDAWGHGTRIAEINGGTVHLIQYNAWSSPGAVLNGGRMYMFGSLFMHQGNQGFGPDIIINEGAEAAAVGGNIGFFGTGGAARPLSIVNNAHPRLYARNNLNTNAAPIAMHNFYNIAVAEGGAGYAATPRVAKAGETVTINAGTAPAGQMFAYWTSENESVVFANATNASTTFTMVTGQVAVTANWISVDRAALAALIETAQNRLPDIANYTPASWSALLSALEGAIAVYEDAGATQEAIGSAAAALQAAIDALVPAIDFTLLQALVTAATALDQADYTAVSWVGFAQALADAQAVLANADATQSQVNSAHAILQAAIGNLVGVTVTPQPPQLPPQPPVTPQPPLPPIITDPPSSLPLLPLVSRNQQQPADDADTDDVYYEAYDEEYDDEPADDVPGEAPPVVTVNTLIFTVGSQLYLLNGQSRTGVGAAFIDHATDRMMVPLRTLAEALGVEVEWDSATRSALIHLPTGTISIPADDMLPDGMGSTIIVSDRVFVPLRFVMYAFNATVEWDSANRAAVISW